MRTVNYLLKHFTDDKKNHPRVDAYVNGIPDDNINEEKIILYATYMRELGNRVPGKFDGATLIERDDKKFIRVICGNDGRGSDNVVGKDFDYAVA